MSDVLGPLYSHTVEPLSDGIHITLTRHADGAVIRFYLADKSVLAESVKAHMANLTESQLADFFAADGGLRPAKEKPSKSPEALWESWELFAPEFPAAPVLSDADLVLLTHNGGTYLALPFQAGPDSESKVFLAELSAKQKSKLDAREWSLKSAVQQAKRLYLVASWTTFPRLKVQQLHRPPREWLAQQK